MTERDVILNELARGLRPMSQGIAWFDALAPEEQSEALLFLRHHCVQARAVAEDGPAGIRRAGLRPSFLPRAADDTLEAAPDKSVTTTACQRSTSTRSTQALTAATVMARTNAAGSQ
ncbi:DUF5958 family protein [Streptomyces sp. NPDC047022]|uniref:DUF5958 family protein n=1 Tax=Streptomyces sp. NPDC047022 TaxID=3155737 RepID=UPI0033EEC666